MITTNRFFHVNKRSRGFFEGWYFKHQIGSQVYAFIPGISIDDKGEKHAFIQVISQDTAHYFHFPAEEMKVDEVAQQITIGDNLFSLRGIKIALHSAELSIEGSLTYDHLTPIKHSTYAPSVMGPFSYLSFMECYHGILSMGHTLSGTLSWNGEVLALEGGKGYIEKDWGTSFPAAYIWVQSNLFDNADARFFFSAADIPFLGSTFLGLICILQIGDKEYRFATYYGGKITDIVREEDRLTVLLRQKDLQLAIIIETMEGHPLQAPSRGAMGRIIRESASTTFQLTLKQNGQDLLTDRGTMAGFEEVGNLRGFRY